MYFLLIRIQGLYYVFFSLVFAGQSVPSFHMLFALNMQVNSTTGIFNSSSSLQVVQNSFLADTTRASSGNSLTRCSGVTLLGLLAHWGGFRRLPSCRRFGATFFLFSEDSGACFRQEISNGTTNSVDSESLTYNTNCNW